MLAAAWPADISTATPYVLTPPNRRFPVTVTGWAVSRKGLPRAKSRAGPLSDRSESYSESARPGFIDAASRTLASTLTPGVPTLRD